jgi:hypothetical protein
LSDDAAAERALNAERKLWQAERASGQASIGRGALALLTVPLAFALSIAAVIGFGIVEPMWIGITYAVFGGAYGSTRVANGLAKSRRATKALKALAPVAQLPAARVVKG